MATNVIYPQLAYINDITNAQAAVVTFTDDHDFTLGEIVSFRVRPEFGMFQINNVSGKVIASSSTTITVNVDTTDWDVFDYSALDTAGSMPPIAVPSASWIVPSSNPAIVNQTAAFDNRRS